MDLKDFPWRLWIQTIPAEPWAAQSLLICATIGRQASRFTPNFHPKKPPKERHQRQELVASGKWLTYPLGRPQPATKARQ